MTSGTASGTIKALKAEIADIVDRLRFPRTPAIQREVEALTADLVGCMDFLRKLEAIEEEA